MTLIGQAITFAIFVWFTMKFVWPIIMAAMEEREEKIADGLAAAEKARHDLDKTREEINSDLNKAREKASSIVSQANQRAASIVEEAEVLAKDKYNKIVDSAHDDLVLQTAKIKNQLKNQIVEIAVKGAEKILNKNLDAKAQNDLLGDLVKDLER
tara:strand:- start:10880 stop:11344 length:465 start_codon:yes stop_codon:yes gene_type:complete